VEHSDSAKRHDEFETDAARFYQEAHILAPGKSEPRGVGHDIFTRRELRGRLWNLWSLKEQQLAECKAKTLRDAAVVCEGRAGILPLESTERKEVGRRANELRRMAEEAEREAKNATP